MKLAVMLIILSFSIFIGTGFAQSNSEFDNCPQGTTPEVRGTNIECIPISNVERTCPQGTYQGRDNQGNFACRDIETNQIIDPQTGLMYDSQTGDLILQDNQIGYVVVGVIVLIIIVGVAAAKSKKGQELDSYVNVERKPFSPLTKERVKEIQHGKCAECGKYPTHWEFDHINTRGDNSIENCQGLCLDCHQSKTRRDDWRNTRN